jgi:serine/threonine protein phosphatase 1
MIEFRTAPGLLPPGRRIYAIGDVHGCDARLAALHVMVAEDLARRPCPAPLLVHLGDYVDRGPDSRGVVRRLAAGDPLPGMPTVNLLGNHEVTMLDALGGEGAAMTDWMIHGGREALASWGGDPDAPRGEWAAHVPAADMAFLHGLALMHREGGYLFAHAGIRPGVPLAEQSRQDLVGIRQPFLLSEADLGVVVVHGHTPRTDPVLRHNRIGIDTGAVYGGRLTCAVLEDDQVGFLFA